MKVIELFNKIANGEEVPKKFIYEDNLYYLQKEKCYRSDDTNDIFESQFIFEDLNNEIEIIKEPQEHKIPEKLNQDNFQCVSNLEVSGQSANYFEYGLEDEIRDMVDKINEIIDYLEDLK